MASSRTPAAASDHQDDIEAEDFPTREYIGAMALEMARMAREGGDGRVAGLLEDAARRRPWTGRTTKATPVRRAGVRRGRSG